jgi:2-octaprenyl-6-methoxyphenol hydroxylase
MRELRTSPAPIRRIHVSRSGDFGRVKLDASTYGRDAFGQVVVARDFGHALEARLRAATGLARYRPARFTALEDDGGDARRLRIVDDSGERVLSTRLLVAADGTASGVRAALGIGVDRHDYGQALFVARIRAERAADGTAYERFGASGPTALLPRSDRHSEADTVAALDDDAFIGRLQQAFGWRAGRFQSIGPRSRYPAISQHAQAITARRAVLVGNAAQTLHPIGAQGFNLGLRDALTLAELVEQHRDDPGSERLLSEYTRRRREDHARTVAFSDGLARLTANDAPLLRPLRSLGLLALDGAPWLQAMLVGGAMGYRGDVPRLCRTGA